MSTPDPIVKDAPHACPRPRTCSLSNRGVLVILLVALLLVSSCAMQATRIISFYEAPSSYSRAIRMTAALASHMDRMEKDKYGVVIIDSGELNAFMSDYTVILPSVTPMTFTDPELTCVIAHEIAHQSLGHHQRRASAQTSPDSVFSSVKTDAGLLTSILKPLALKAYSREHEIEADTEAVRAVRSIGGSPEACVNALRKFKENGKGRGGGLLDTHPALDERITILENMVRED